MGNTQSGGNFRPRKNVHWKAAERPSPPGKPDIIPSGTEEEQNAVTLRWLPPRYDGGSQITGFGVECNRLGSPVWLRTAPQIVLRPELILTGLEPGFRYQFRISAENAAGMSNPSEISDILTVSLDKTAVIVPKFVDILHDVKSMENEKTEFKVYFEGSPQPTISWFKDGFEIFSSRRTSIITEGHCSTLIFHQTSLSDEGEIKCTATNRAGHSVTRARLVLEAAPRIRLPRQYEDGLLYETGETIFLKISVVGKPAPTVEWIHDGRSMVGTNRIEISNTEKFSTVRIANAGRNDRGEYQINAKNRVGEDSASFLVTITARPDPPESITVIKNDDRSVSLSWVSPNDDGGCQVGNYIIEYYRTGWDVWLKAATSRKLTATLFDLIEGSEYRFRIKAESPYGMSEPSAETPSIFIPGKSADIRFDPLEVPHPTESSNTNEIPQIAPRRKRQYSPQSDDTENVQKYSLDIPAGVTLRKHRNVETTTERHDALKEFNHEQTKYNMDDDKMKLGSSEFMLVLYPEGDNATTKEKRKSFQFDLEDAMTPPPISLSAPDLTNNVFPIRPLRNSVSSTELLHEHAMDRFYQVVALKEAEKVKARKEKEDEKVNKIPLQVKVEVVKEPKQVDDTIEEYQERLQENIEYTGDSEKQNKVAESDIYQTDDGMSNESLNRDRNDESGSIFEDDYTASTVSTGDSEFSDSDSLDEDVENLRNRLEESTTYHPKEIITKGIPYIQGNQSQAVEVLSKPAPLPDPNFIPKPILKRREPEIVPENIPVTNSNEKTMKYSEPLINKVPLFKKFAKFPMEKNSVKENKATNKKDKNSSKSLLTDKDSSTNKDKTKKEEIEPIQDEGRSVIEHYGDIVKEFGKNKKPTQPLYANTEQLKKAAAEQESNISEDVKKPPIKKPPIKKPTPQKKIIQKNSTEKAKPIPVKSSISIKTEDSKKDSKTKEAPKPKLSVPTKRVLPIEKASVPKDFSEINAEAENNVRTVFNYVIDIFMLIVAFWLYIFKDERLAIPFLGLTMYRQLNSAVRSKLPSWILKRKTSVE